MKHSYTFLDNLIPMNSKRVMWNNLCFLYTYIRSKLKFQISDCIQNEPKMLVWTAGHSKMLFKIFMCRYLVFLVQINYRVQHSFMCRDLVFVVKQNWNDCPNEWPTWLHPRWTKHACMNYMTLKLAIYKRCWYDTVHTSYEPYPYSSMGSEPSSFTISFL